MGKSLEYIKKRIEEGNCNDMSMKEFQDMYEIPFKSYFLEDDKDYMVIATRKDRDGVFADLTYEPDAEFNYFITETCICDGTLMFMAELIMKIMQKIVQLKTCYAPAIKDITENNFNNYILHYYVGDFIANSYIVEPPDKNRLWMCDKFTVMLPVKFMVEYRKEENERRN